jgi:putative transposase
MLTEARARAPWLRDGASVPQQQIIRDFAKSRSKALKDTEKRLPMRQRAGMPWHKKKRGALPTLNCTTRGFRLKDGRLRLAGGIALTVVWSRELPSAPSSVRVYGDAVGHWYASFVVAAEAQRLPATGRVLGVDRGVEETATTTSDAHDLPHPQHGRKAQAKPTRYDRMTARRKPKNGRPDRRAAERRRSAAPRRTRRSPGRGRTPPASGPRRSSATMTPSPSRTSGRSSSAVPPWPVKPLTRRSVPRRRP